MAEKTLENRQTARDEVDLLALVARLWAGRAWVFGMVLLALLVGAFMVLRAVPIYQASGLMQLETRAGSMALPESMQALMGGGASGQAAVETEIEIMRSRMVIGEAVRELGLQVQASPRHFPVLGVLPRRLDLPDPGIWPARAWGNENIRLGELEVPEAWLSKPIELTIIGPAQYSILLPDGSRHDGTVRQRLDLPGPGVALVVDELRGPVGRQFDLVRLELEMAVRAVQLAFSVNATSRNATILRLIYSDPDSRQAERVLNAIARAYVAQNVARGAAEAENSLRFIEEQLPLAQQAVNEAQQGLNTYRQAQHSVDVEYETRSLLERATRIEASLSELTLQEEELKKRYTINHPTYQLLLENRGGLERQLAALRDETGNLPETQKEIFNLTRDLEVAQQVYVQLLNRAQELRVVRASTVGSARIIDTAYSDGQKISPKTAMTLAVAMVVGLMLGVGIVVVRGLLRRGVRGTEEIEQIGIPVFGTILYSPDASEHRNSRGTLPIYAIEKPDSLVIEALRSLRTALHFGLLDANNNAVLMTSSAPAAGKSFVSVNLAAVAAQGGQRVCLIDADMRRGYMRRYFGRPKNTPGLAEYLANDKTLDEVLFKGPVDGMSVILSGRYPPNPSELLMRAEFRNLLAELNTRFDLVLIDSPPVLAVTDPVVIGRYVGATIMVVRYMETVPGEIEAVRQAFETAGTKITGAILNGFRQEDAHSYGGSRYQYYNYRYSYQSSQDD